VCHRPQVSALLARRRTAAAEHLLRPSTTWVIAASWPMYLSLAAFARWCCGCTAATSSLARPS
jgi:hypothetical protein